MGYILLSEYHPVRLLHETSNFFWSARWMSTVPGATHISIYWIEDDELRHLLLADISWAEKSNYMCIFCRK